MGRFLHDPSRAFARTRGWEIVMRSGLLLAAMSGLSIACGGSEAPAIHPGGASDPADAGPADAGPACAFPLKGQLSLPQDTASATLSGESRNRSTTCTTDRGTGGPDDFYLLHVAARTGVEIA